MIFMQQTVKMPQPRHSRAKEHDRKWRESNKLKVKVKNKDQYTKTLQKRLEDPELHVKMKADGVERTRKWRAKKNKAMLVNVSNPPESPPPEPSSPGTSSAPTEEPDVPEAPVPSADIRAAAVLRITSGRRTRGTAPAQLQESDQEDAEAPSNKLVEGL